MQMPLKCTEKVTETLKMAEDSRQAPREINKITIVLLFSTARKRNYPTQVSRTHRETSEVMEKGHKAESLECWFTFSWYLL